MRENLRFYRLRKGLTQVDLAKKIGVTQQSIAKWEQGKAEVSLKYVAAISKALGVRKELLFPELKVAVEEKKAAQKEALEALLGHQGVFKFKGRGAAYFAQIDENTMKRIQSQLWDINERHDESIDQIWFDTVDGMAVVLNKCQLEWVEMGMDLDEPQDRLPVQVLGENNPQFESEGDDRKVRLFVAGVEPPYIDLPDSNDDHCLLEIMYNVLNDFLDQQEFASFDYDTGNDMRRVFFRASAFQLIEAPKAVLDAYFKRHG